jgi:hypothetical protein
MFVAIEKRRIPRQSTPEALIDELSRRRIGVEVDRQVDLWPLRQLAVQGREVLDRV